MSTADPTVRTHKHGKHVFVITLNRPAKRNAVDAHTAALLADCFRRFEEDDSSRVAVLTGNGENFCAGYDLSWVAHKATTVNEQEARKLVIGENPELGPMGPSRYNLSKPLIAAVSGYAVAGGLELSLLADMRVADETAVFGVFCRRIGVPLTDGGSVRLPKLIGLSHAMDMILTGRPVKAREALQMGLVNRVVRPSQSLRVALKLATEIAEFTQDALLADRSSALKSTYNATPLKEALRDECMGGIDALLKGEARENARRFVQEGAGRHGSFDDFKSKL